MMKWYVKDLSKLTNVSVQTLHHYDRIDLLKPSLRLANGYRLYSEKDLLKLQQIIALKFFGFELSKIKILLVGNASTLEHFSVQAQFLEKKAKTYTEASQTLKSIISNVKDDKSILWETIIKLIEVYHMTQQLEKTWAGEVLTPDELKQYANFQNNLQIKFDNNPESKTAFLERRLSLIALVKNNINNDPKSNVGLAIAKDWMNMINNIYDREHANLKYAIWEKGFKKGKINDERFIDKKVIKWLDQAIDAYYRDRIYRLLSQVEENKSNAGLVDDWEALIEEMYGDSTELKHSLFEAIMKDDKINEFVKKWVRQHE